MNSLLRFIVRNHVLLLFLALEGFSFWMLATNSFYQRSKIETVTRSFYGFTSSKIDKGRQYLNLYAINEQLAKENLDLRQQVSKLSINLERFMMLYSDSVASPNFSLIPAKVINNSTNKQYNYITLNVGKKEGIEPEMGVITNNGIVGIVAGVSENYSTIISLLNLDLRISARLKKSGHFGSLFWDGMNYRDVVLTEIPQHVGISEGDTVISSGFSAIFPSDINIGTISHFDTKAGNFYNIRVTLLSDFKQLNYVWVVKNLNAMERKVIDNQTM